MPRPQPAPSSDLETRLRALGLQGRAVTDFRPQAAADEPGDGVFRFGGPIVSPDWSMGDDSDVTAPRVESWLRKQDGDIRVDINSPGGSYFSGVEIANMFRVYDRGAITMRITGMAASAASVVAMAGRPIEMMPGSMMMIHRAWTVAIGDAPAMEAEAAFLAKLDGEACRIYAARSGGDEDEIMAKMTAETWMTSAEAVAAGFADEEMPPDMAAAGADEDEPDMSAETINRALQAVALGRYMIAHRLRALNDAAARG